MSTERNVSKTLSRLATLLHDYRIEQGLTQQDIADRMGVSQPAVSAFESAEGYSITTLKRYADALDVSVSFSVSHDASDTSITVPLTGDCEDHP